MRGLATPTTPSTLADWVEIRLLLTGTKALSKAQLVDILQEDRPLEDLEAYDRAVEDSDLDESESDGPTEHGSPDPAEVLAEDTFGVIESRLQIVGNGYPFDVTNIQVVRARDRPIYRFLCALEARHLSGTRRGLHKGARLFELVSAVAMSNYLGGEARAIGFPRRDESGFRKAVNSLVREMRENLSVPLSSIPGSIKDLGVDVAAWKPLDAAPGNAVILCQCATGGNWQTKGVGIEAWSKAVRHAVTPTRAVTVPFIPDLDPRSFDWELMCGHIGIPIHRLRIAKLIQLDDVSEALRAELAIWSDDVAEVVFGTTQLEATDEENPEVVQALEEALDGELPAIVITTGGG